MKPIPELSAVRPTDEFLVFEVASFTDPAKVYRVDKSLWWGSGSCSCEQFCCRIQPRLAVSDWTAPTTCKHIQIVDRFLACEVARRAIETRLGGKQYNPIETNI